MPVEDDQIEPWRQNILVDSDFGAQALRHLDDTDHERFVAICHTLVHDPSPVVGRVSLHLLGGSHGDADDPVTEAAAIGVLGRKATPQVFPLLLTTAQHGETEALWAAARQARTAEQRQQVLEIARQQVLAEDARMRSRALLALKWLASPAAEEDLLLVAAQRWHDPSVFAMLRAATPRVLPALYALQATLSAQDSVQQTVARTITFIEQGSRPPSADDSLEVWRQRILADKEYGRGALEHLERENRQRYLEICRHLVGTYPRRCNVRRCSCSPRMAPPMIRRPRRQRSQRCTTPSVEMPLGRRSAGWLPQPPFPCCWRRLRQGRLGRYAQHRRKHG